MRANILSANQYYSELRNLSKEVKNGNPKAINYASKLMAQMVGEHNCIFIPIPSHNGYSTYTKLLAELIAKRTNGICLDILLGDEREQFYNIKKTIDIKKIETINLGFHISNNEYNIIDYLKGKKIFLIDNVIATGETYKQAALLLKKYIGYIPKLLTITNDTTEEKVNGIKMKNKIGYIKENRLIELIEESIKKLLFNN